MQASIFNAFRGVFQKFMPKKAYPVVITSAYYYYFLNLFSVKELNF
jgi:hypothetical protein